MSYDISFKVKVEGVDKYVRVGTCDANITWNLREMICKSTGLEWENEASNGLCKDVIPYIQEGLSKLEKYPIGYMKYNSPNGYGTIDGCKRFFREIIKSWDEFCNDYYTRDFVDVVTFWVE